MVQVLHLHQLLCACVCDERLQLPADQISNAYRPSTVAVALLQPSNSQLVGKRVMNSVCCGLEPGHPTR